MKKDEIIKGLNELITAANGSFAQMNKFEESFINELKMAKKHFENEYYTETGVRLGRATECLVYCFATKCGYQGIKNVTILKDWPEALIGKRRSLAEVEAHARRTMIDELIEELQKRIEAIQRYQQEPDKIETFQLPFPPERRDPPQSISFIWDRSSRGKLNIDSKQDKQERERLSNLIQAVMMRRNCGAHANPRGDVQEIDEATCCEMCEGFLGLIHDLISKFIVVVERPIQNTTKLSL